MSHSRMTPDDFVKLQEYANFSQCKLKDAISAIASATLSQEALKEFTEMAAANELQRISSELIASEDLTFEQFSDFLRFYLTADVGVDIARRLFGSLNRTTNRRRSKVKYELRQSSAGVAIVRNMNSILKQKAVEAFTNPYGKKVSSNKKKNVPPKLEKRSSTKTALTAAAMGASAALHVVGSSDNGRGAVCSVPVPDEAVCAVSPTSVGELPAASDAVVSLQDVVCFLCLLESGSPSDKLGLLFRFYDLDNSGYLEREELGCILDQMMTVSACLGWDTTELRPILEEMLQELDLNDDGLISKEEWMASTNSKIPLLVLLGIETNLQEGGHRWRLKRFHSSVHCNLCRNHLLYEQGFSCNLCRLVVHERCLVRFRQSCIRTYVKSRKTTEVMLHHWVEGNCLGKCSCCERTIKKRKMLSGLTCSWCHRVLHNGCESSLPTECDLGQHKVYVVSPICIRPSTLMGDAQEEPSGTVAIAKHPNLLSEEGFRLQISDLSEHSQPLVVFVNPKSGGKQGIRVFRQMQYLLNPRQVFDLTQGGPTPGLQFIGSLPNSRVLCCGGDGTVGWILSALDKMKLETKPPVGVLPLGTGNDLARCLKWGGGYEGGSLDKVLLQMAKAETIYLDRWKIEVNNLPEAAVEGDKVPYSVMNNYFSVGVDASIAHKFHVMREKHPEKFNSRVRNKLWYFEIASQENFSASCRDLADKISIECDGQSLQLAKRSLEGIAILNIPSIYGGTALWGSSNESQSTTRETSPSAAYRLQAMDDKLLEVVGVQGALHMGQIRMGFKQSGIRLAQCSIVTLRTSSMLPMQIDGEPWMQQACEVTISHLNQMPMLQQRLPARHQRSAPLSCCCGLFRKRHDSLSTRDS